MVAGWKPALQQTMKIKRSSKKLRASAWCTVNFQARSLLTQGSTNNRKRVQSPPKDVSQQHNKFPDSYLATLLPAPALLLLSSHRRCTATLILHLSHSPHCSVLEYPPSLTKPSLKPCSSQVHSVTYSRTLISPAASYISALSFSLLFVSR